MNIELLKARLDGSAYGLANPNHPKEPTIMKVETAKLARHLGLPANAHESMIRARLAGVEAEREIRATMASLASTKPDQKKPLSVPGKPLSSTRSVGGHSEHRPGGLGLDVDAEESLIEAFRQPVDLLGQVAASSQRNVAAETEPAPKGERTGWFDPPGEEWWTEISGPPLPRA
jgi:hypothetical protein